MSTFRERFQGRHTFLAVIHVERAGQALRNVKIAKENGADGVFLINHSIVSVELLQIYHEVKRSFLGYWIGLNCLDFGRGAIEVIPCEVSGLWTDDAGVCEGDEPTKDAEIFARRRKEVVWNGLYFGGVAFKYQKQIADVGKAASLAVPLMDVITTSGSGTGQAADVEKIRTMKEAIGDYPLAIASGITPENVHEYMPYADCFIVATGISNSHTELNPNRVQQLAKMLGK